MIKNPDITLGRTQGGKNLFNILERENSILGLMGQMIMHTNQVTFIYSSNKATRQRICDYLKMSPNTYDRVLKLLVERKVMRRVARGTYMFDKKLVNLNYDIYNFGTDG